MIVPRVDHLSKCGQDAPNTSSKYKMIAPRVSNFASCGMLSKVM